MSDQVLGLSIKVNTDTGALEVLGSKLKDVASQAKGTESSFSGLTEGASGLVGALGIVATGAGIIEFFKNAVTEANADAEAIRHLQFALEANGVSWTENKAQIMSWSEGIQALTRFSNTEALDSLGQLSKATKDVGQAQEGVKVAMGLSVAAAMPLSQALDLMQGLMMGNQRAIMMAHRELGTFVGNAKTAQEMLDALSAKVGQASMQEDSFTKSSKQLANAWDDFSKKIGAEIIPSMTSVVEFLTKALTKMDDFNSAADAWRAKAVNSVDGTFASIKAIVTGNSADVKKILQDVASANATINQGVTDKYAQEEAKKTAALTAATSQRSRIIAAAALQDQKKKEDEAAKFIEIEQGLQKKMDELGVQTLKKKLDALNAETEMKRAQIEKEIEDQTKKEQLLVDLERWKSASAVELNREESNLKMEASFKVATTAIQTLQTMNDMSNKDSEAEKARAIALLALQQAIAIGWAWVHAVRIGGPFAPAIAAAETTLLVAQFASQVQSIEKSSASANSQIQNVAISSIPLPGGGQLITTQGSGLNGDLSGNAPTPDGGLSLTSVLSSAGAGAPASGSGSGQTVNVNIPQIIINVAVDTLEAADRRAILQALGDELRSASVEAIRFAVTSANLAQTNTKVAV